MYVIELVYKLLSSTLNHNHNHHHDGIIIHSVVLSSVIFIVKVLYTTSGVARPFSEDARPRRLPQEKTSG